MKTQHDPADNTRERILASAEKLFAEKGYDGVSVREITQDAECNLAAVNYHFGNKKNLYFDVFRYLIIPQITEVRSQFEKILSREKDVNIETLVRAFTKAFMGQHISADDHTGHHSLVYREIHNPTGALEMVLEEAMSPFFQVLVDLFKHYLSENMSDTQIKLNIFSILSMSQYFAHARVPVSKITGKEYDDTFVNQLIDHTVSFALYGLSGNNEEGA
jgi:AcrR family transcriptional regulator